MHPLAYLYLVPSEFQDLTLALGLGVQSASVWFETTHSQGNLTSPRLFGTIKSLFMGRIIGRLVDHIPVASNSNFSGVS